MCSIQPTTIGLVCCWLILQACQGDCAKNTGTITKQSRPLTAFKQVIVRDGIQLQLIQSTEERLDLEAGANLLSGIQAQQEGDVLTIQNNNACNWVRNQKIPIKATLYFKDLEVLTMLGFGNLTTPDTLRLNQLRFVHNGQGDADLLIRCPEMEVLVVELGNVTLAGNATRLTLTMDSFGSFRGERLQVSECTLAHSAEGDAWLRVSKLLQGELRNVGNVWLWGNPTIAVEQRRSGRIIFRP